MLFCTYADLDDERIAEIADTLAWEMDDYQMQYSLRDWDQIYTAMDKIYSRHIAELQSRGWTLDEISLRIHCPKQ
jgi:hypothetical protein